MAEKPSAETPVPEDKNMPTPRRLRTLDEIAAAHEWLFEQTRAGRMDNKTADVLNTTLKGVVYLHGKLPLEYQRLYVQAQIKKLDVSPGLRAALGM
jgi:hypothetical protein